VRIESRIPVAIRLTADSERAKKAPVHNWQTHSAHPPCLCSCSDVQEKFRAGIHKFATVVTGCQRMVRAAQELKIPVIATEQYPKGLGHTVEEIDTSHELTTVVAKTDFSMIVPEVVAKLDGLNRTDAVILGLEAHVCVQQSTLDLINMGYNVHLCVDAVSSQTTTDRSCGLHRAAGAGALLTTTESVLFELIRSKDHPSFKAISTTVKELKASDPLGFM
jgi:nicotinamidase-related amidase